MSSTKRPYSPTTHNLQQQSNTKRSKNESLDEIQQPHLNSRVVLNPADSNLDFNIEGDGLIGHALHTEGFAYCWSGARGSVGITDGKYYFGCRIISHQPVNMEDTPIDQQNVCRIGISQSDDPVGNLGETPHSYGYGGTGRFSNEGKFSNYGEKFGVGDTIICLVDLESEALGSIEFCKNGKRLGIARKFNTGPNGLGLIEKAFYPHVLLKNVVVEMKFSLDDGLDPIEGFRPWDLAMKDGNGVSGPSFCDPSDCEVLMMVGLPASGKSTWAENWIKEHPKKRYVLLGTNLALDQMKVPGLLRKGNYGERFERLMDRATGIFNTLLSRASKVPRNYILDQTNVYKSARKRKLKPFASFRKIAVVVFPNQDELKSRAKKRFQEMGKEVPPEAVNEMLANFVLPMSKDMRGADEYFDEVMFTELNRDEAQHQLNEMKGTLTQSSPLKPKTLKYQPPYSRDSSFVSDPNISPSSIPGSRYLSSGYSSSLAPSVPHDASFRSPRFPQQPLPANVRELRHVEPVQPYLNENYGGSSYQMHCSNAYEGGYSDYGTPVPRAGYMQYGSSYTRDSPTRLDGPLSYGTTTGYMRNDTGATYQLPPGLTYDAPIPRPHGGYQPEMLHPRAPPYGGSPPRFPPRYY